GKRRSASAATLMGRLARFHLLNGMISMTGNLLLMRALAGTLHLDPIAANITAIIFCSIANFVASEAYVFKRAVLGVVLVLMLPWPTRAAERNPAPGPVMLAVDLQPHTLEAWSTYEKRVDGRYDGTTASSSPFFAQDAFNAAAWRATAIRGGVALAQIDRARPGDAELPVPDGKIHHWAGAIFVPDISIASLLDRLSRLAGNEAQHYEDVIASKLLSKDGDRYRIFMKLRRTKVITATYNTEHAVEYRRLSPTRARARSVSTRIAELDEAGTPAERERKVGSDSGYLWRLNAYWRYEAVNGGVLIECESVSLSRSVPFLLRPLISGVVEGLAKESLERTLVGLRTYLRSSSTPNVQLPTPKGHGSDHLGGMR
ncbi:MAG: GtrA family protein, partial [Vicinamibacterales bacterium]